MSIVLHLNNNKIQVEKILNEKDCTYNSIIESLPDNDTRWLLINIKYRTMDGGERTKLTFVAWIPDSIRRVSLKESARVKTNGLFYSQCLKPLFPNVICFITANDFDDMKLDAIIQKASKYERERVNYNSIFLGTSDVRYLLGIQNGDCHAFKQLSALKKYQKRPFPWRHYTHCLFPEDFKIRTKLLLMIYERNNVLRYLGRDILFEILQQLSRLYIVE